ncbi:hypothetical protein KGF54_001775 [Candida jiufengensis]|uniref:uncharacterized protein n=1 Tax=Candida jiufengensis TaxID=497108 RepID=UPI002224479A|nr:uncharacterized protein KGF54_001775 [Candida jiufengensis]KAI5955214.1 hypothetical protein KGF54_001775 [Candida jiufengensis]
MTSAVDQRSSSPPFKKQRLDSLNHSFSHSNNNSQSNINNNTINKLPSDLSSNGNSKFHYQLKSDPIKNHSSSIPDNAEIIMLSDDDEEEMVQVKPQPTRMTKPIIPNVLNNGTKEEDIDDDIVILNEADVKKIGFKPTSFNSNIIKPQPILQPPSSSTSSQPPPVPQVQQQQQYPPIIIPGTFNQPAPVPQVTDNLQQISQAELKTREATQLQEINRLEEMKTSISSKIQQNSQQFEKENTTMKQLNVRLKQANDLGKHDLVNRIRKAVAVVQRAMNGHRSNVNQLQTSLQNLERMVIEHRNKLSLITNQLRNVGHVLNAAINPYAAQIANEMNAEPEVAIQDLLNEILSEENLEKEGLANTPAEMSINLLKHQRIGLTWLLKREDPKSKSKGGVLADDMGLGKTIQTLALILANKSKDPNRKTTLIIAPVSLLRQWAAEVQSKTKPSCNLEVGIYHGDEKRDMVTFSAMKKCDIVLTSYGTLSSEWKKHYKEEIHANKEFKGYIPKNNEGGQSYESPFFSKTSFFYRIVLDEAQNIKNKVSIASKAVHNLKGDFRFCLSGTPMQNKVDELYPILRFLNIKPYCKEDRFREDIATPLKSKSDIYDGFDKNSAMRKLRALLSSILLRRTKNSTIDGEPILNLPAKHLIKDFVKLEDEEWEYYQSIELDVQKEASAMFKNNDKKNIFVLLLRLRQACIHSYLVQISRIKANMKGEQLIKSNWRLQLTHAENLSANVVNSIISRLDGNLTCSICLDLMDEGIAVFQECGHMCCQACIETFLDDYEVDQDSTGRIAKCKDCNTHVKESRIFDYGMFEKLHLERLNRNEVENYYYDLQKSKNLTNLQIIAELNKENNGFETSAKIDKAIEIIKKIQQDHPGEKIIIFSQFTTLFDLLKIVLNHEGIQFLRYDGSLSMDARNSTIKRFYQSNADVLLLSLRAGNVGLTLTCANHVIIMDPFWNPFVEDQAMDRAHRIGQEKEVNVHRILIAGTVEDRISTLQQFKKDLIGDALDEKELKSVSGLNPSELGYLFGLNSLNRPREIGN